MFLCLLPLTLITIFPALNCLSIHLHGECTIATCSIIYPLGLDLGTTYTTDISFKHSRFFILDGNIFLCDYCTPLATPTVSLAEYLSGFYQPSLEYNSIDLGSRANRFQQNVRSLSHDPVLRIKPHAFSKERHILARLSRRIHVFTSLWEIN